MKAQLRVGQLLVRKGKLTLTQVSQVLSLQRHGDTRQFGQIAVALGLVSERDVALVLLSSDR